MNMGDQGPLEEAKRYGLRLLALRARTEAELRGRLAGRGFGPQVVEAALAALRSLDLVDDGQFARAWVEARQATRPLGRRGLRWELMKHGIPASLAQEVVGAALDSEGELALALALGRKRLQGRQRPARADLARLRRFLAGRGLEPEIVREALLRLGGEEVEVE